MPSIKSNCDQVLFNGIKSIFENSDLKTYEKMVMIVIKMYHVEYGDAFPDYDTIAAAGGMSKRKAQYVVKDLHSRNMIEKTKRFKELADGTRKQTSNQYVLVEDSVTTQPEENKDAPDASNAQHAPGNHFLYAQHAPYKSRFYKQDSFNLLTSTKIKEDEEEIYITREREIESKKYARYAEVYEQMVQDQGTGVLCYKQSTFLDTCLSYNLPACLINELFPHVRSVIQKYHYDAIERTFEKFVTRLAKKKIDNPISWFVATYRNEDIKVRAESQLHDIKYVS